MQIQRAEYLVGLAAICSPEHEVEVVLADHNSPALDPCLRTRKDFDDCI